MFNATLTSKGQTTIPAAVREQLGLMPQDKLMFSVMHDGSVIMRVKSRKLADLAGIARQPGAPRLPDSALRRP